MSGFRTAMVGFWRLFMIVVNLGLLVACLLLAYSYYHLFNFEELNIPDYVNFIFTFLAPAFMLYYYLERSKVDMGRKTIVRNLLLGKKTEIPFDEITGYKLFESWGTICVFTNVIRMPVNIRKQPEYDALLEWLEANRPTQELKRFDFGAKGWIPLLALFVLSISVRLNRDPINNYVRYNFPFNPVETVEVSGVYKKRRYQKLQEKGPFTFMSFELNEYPDLRFNVSTYLQDEVSVDLPESLNNSMLYLTINKEDYDMVVVGKSDFLLKESVRTYEVRTGNQILLKKNLSILK